MPPNILGFNTTGVGELTPEQLQLLENLAQQQNPNLPALGQPANPLLKTAMPTVAPPAPEEQAPPQAPIMAPQQPSILGSAVTGAAANQAAEAALGAVPSITGSGAPTAAPELLAATAGASPAAAAPAASVGTAAALGQAPNVLGLPFEGFLPGAAGVGGAINAASELGGFGESTEETTEAITTALGTGVGAFFGGPLGAAAGSFLGDVVGDELGNFFASFASGKGEDQVKRDALRSTLERIGFARKNERGSHIIDLADGTTFDIGRDGGARLVNPAGAQRQVFDVDFSDPRAGSVVGLINPLAAILTGDEDKLRSDLTGYFTNAALSSGDIIQNIKKFYMDAFKDADGNRIEDVAQIREAARQQILKLVEEDRISEEERDAHFASIDRLFLTNDPLTAPGAEGGDEGAAALAQQILQESK